MCFLPPRIPLGILTLALLRCPLALYAWTPGPGSPDAVQGFVVDPMNRTDVLSFYNCIYPASQNDAAKLAWTGSVAACIAGTTIEAFKDDVRRRINFYRALAALPADIVFDPVKSGKAQQAALMMSRNNNLSHTPPASWECYTADGAAAAGASNLAHGTYGSRAVDEYMADSGGGNQMAGHRRWLMYSRAPMMGTGDIPGEQGYAPTNVIWVIGDARAAPVPQFVAWPSRGFVPFPLMHARWSLSYPQANFGAATVTMTQGGKAVATTVVSRTDHGFGDNTIVWEPSGLPASIAADTACSITVSGISGAGIPASFSYTVTLFDPEVLGSVVTIAGSSTPAVTGAEYTFNCLAGAEAYELRVSTGDPVAWAEGAEDVPAPQILSKTTGGYSLIQSALKRSGARAFQLAFPDFSDQSFEIIRDVVPSATSQLVFYELGRFATTTTLGAEVSTDLGATWTSVFSRPGVGLSSGLWNEAFIGRSVSLAAYAGQVVRVRFILRSHDQSVILATNVNSGFFIDDISITHATGLVNTTTTVLGSGATGFTLNAAAAGTPLVADTTYFLRMRPKVGSRWFGDGAFKKVTAQAPASYAGWVTAQYPGVTEGANGDHESDGIPNGIEYGFGLDPTRPDAASAVPQPVRDGNALTVTYTLAASLPGVTYGAQWSSDFVSWHNLSDYGSGNTHTFTVSTVGQQKVFFRHRIVIAP